MTARTAAPVLTGPWAVYGGSSVLRGDRVMDLDLALRESIAKICGVPADQVTSASTLEDLGVDSLAAAEIITDVEIRAGIELPMDVLRGLSQLRTVGEVAGHLQAGREPGDLTVVSLHWGSNWGYEVGRDQVAFAHRLIDGGVGLVHGHSSHHPRPIEVYRGRLILYGCGDFIDDYEGIAGHREYRDDLRLMYFATLRRRTGELTELRMVPMQARKMRLSHASGPDRRWLAATLGRISRPFGAAVELAPDGFLVLHPAAGRR